MSQTHPSGIRQDIVDKIISRRGRLHAFASLNPEKTALIVIDLDQGTGRDNPERVKNIARNVTTLALELRQYGGKVAWVTTPIQKASKNFYAVFGKESIARYEADAASGKSKTLWPELKAKPGDIYATKSGHSAFFPGKSDLHEQLQGYDIKTLLIVGAVTNVCCEASARDAAELHYKVTLVSDALIGWNEEQDQATFATFARCYGDVRPVSETVQLIEESFKKRSSKT